MDGHQGSTSGGPHGSTFFSPKATVVIGLGTVSMTVLDAERLGLLERQTLEVSWMRYGTDRAWTRVYHGAHLEQQRYTQIRGG